MKPPHWHERAKELGIIIGPDFPVTTAKYGVLVDLMAKEIQVLREGLIYYMPKQKNSGSHGFGCPMKTPEESLTPSKCECISFKALAEADTIEKEIGEIK